MAASFWEKSTFLLACLCCFFFFLGGGESPVLQFCFMNIVFLWLWQKQIEHVLFVFAFQGFHGFLLRFMVHLVIVARRTKTRNTVSQYHHYRDNTNITMINM